jgi:hypothetical protein
MEHNLSKDGRSVCLPRLNQSSNYKHNTNLEVHYLIQNSPLLALIPSNMNRVCAFIYSCFKLHINIILNSAAQIPTAS